MLIMIPHPDPLMNACPWYDMHCDRATWYILLRANQPETGCSVYTPCTNPQWFTFAIPVVHENVMDDVLLSEVKMTAYICDECIYCWGVFLSDTFINSGIWLSGNAGSCRIRIINDIMFGIHSNWWYIVSQRYTLYKYSVLINPWPAAGYQNIFLPKITGLCIG